MKKGEKKPLPHGTPSGYTYHKCRCDECKKFWNHYRENARKKDFPDKIRRRQRYQTLITHQEGKCAICGEFPNKKLCHDHDHDTGLIRGLLCHNCNTGLGHFKDSEKLLLKAIEYLKHPPAPLAYSGDLTYSEASIN
jgi:Autographiviridae endonuclease VII